MANEYTTVAEVKALLGLEDDREDAMLAFLIEMSSRAIDEACHRRFFRVAETRYYTYSGRPESGLLLIDDFGSITTLKTDGGSRTYPTTWLTTDYDLEPFNAAADGKPYTQIRVAGAQSFPTYAKGVQITGPVGYSTLDACPLQIRAAANLQTIRNHARKNTAFGIFGMPAAGTATFISKLDPDVEALLAQFRLEVTA